MKHLHMTLVALFILSNLFKVILLFLGKKEQLAAYRKKMLVPEIALSLAFIGIGFYLWHLMGFASLGGWFHAKLFLVFLSIPLGIVAFKKENLPLAVVTVLILVYVFLLALSRSFTLMG